jgi:hypothetical protein
VTVARRCSGVVWKSCLPAAALDGTPGSLLVPLDASAAPCEPSQYTAMAPREPRAAKAAGSPREEGGPPPEGGGGGGGVTPLMGLPPADDDTHRPQAVRATIDMDNDGMPPASLTAHPHGWQDATRAVVAARRNMDRWSCDFVISFAAFFCPLRRPPCCALLGPCCRHGRAIPEHH